MSLHRAEITPVIEGRNGNNFTRIKISKDKAKLTAKPPGLMLLVSGVMLVGPTIMLGIMIPMFYKDFGWPPALAMSFMLAVFFLVNYALWTSVKCVVFDRAKKVMSYERSSPL